jgi:hypothetical protein
MRSNLSNLTLDNVNVAFDRNFNFTQGRFFVYNDVMITGTNVFAYSSTEPLYIESFGTLHFDLGTTFSFSPYESRPHTGSERDLLRLIDRSAQLYFDGCAINLPDAGLRLTRGTIYFDNRVVINGNISAPNIENSFELGDGYLSERDVDVVILGGANVNINGYLYHNPALPI